MAERSFTDPVRVADIEDSRQSVKPPRWEKHDLTLMLVGGIMGCAVTLLVMVAVIVGITIGG